MNKTIISISGALFCLVCQTYVEHAHHHNHEGQRSVQAEQRGPLNDNHNEYSTESIVAPPVAAVTTSTPVPPSAWMDPPTPLRRVYTGTGFDLPMSMPVPLMALSTKS
jgi:hypothetical protein